MTIQNTPAVSVLLPAYNAAASVRRAVVSILDQTHTDLELIVVDDASTDDTARQVEALSDPRLRLVRLERQQGVAGALNTGLAQCRAPLIARMDADDLAYPERLSTQLAYLEHRPELVALGSWVRLVGAVRGVWKLPIEPAEVEAAMLFTCPICQPSVVLRAEMLEAIGGYPTDFPYAEDYAMLVRLSRLGGLANLPEVLLDYTRHDQSISSRFAAQQQADSARLQRGLLAELGLSVTPETLRLHGLVGSAARLPAGLHAQVIGWIRTLQKANDRAGRFDPTALEAVVTQLAGRLGST